MVQDSIPASGTKIFPSSQRCPVNNRIMTCTCLGYNNSLKKYSLLSAGVLHTVSWCVSGSGEVRLKMIKNIERAIYSVGQRGKVSL